MIYFMFERYVDDPSDYLISVTDSSGKIIHVNKKFCDISKYSESEILGNSHRLIKSGYHDAEFYRNLWCALFNGETWTGFIKNKAKDGTYYWIRSTVIPILDTDKKPYQYTCISITLEHPNEELLNFTNVTNIQKALDHSSIVAITDKDGTITYANKKFCDISKYSKEKLIGQNHRILKSGFHPPIFFSQMWATISSGNVWQGDIKNKAKDGTYYWMRTTIMPIFDHKHNTKQFVSIRTDVTELYEAKAIVHEQLEEIKKLQNQKEEYYAIISHELKSPLMPIIGWCEMLIDEGTKNDKERKLAITEIYDNSKRLLQLITDMLDIQKLELDKTNIIKEEFRVNGFIHDIITDYRKISERYRIRVVDKTKNNISINTDRRLLNQVFSNLVNNAVDFVPSGTGLIEIKMELSYDVVIFSVKDNGIGISKEKQKEIFTKFYHGSSHPRKLGGTGLGLTICKKIVENLGGKIWVESEEGKGATFYFTIPK
jgi:PAS domain S-box-containing protein